MPVPVASKAAVAPPAKDKHECTASIAMPAPVTRIAIDLKPALTIQLCRFPRVSVSPADLARVNVEARMALAEMRGVRIRRVVVVADPSAAL